MDDGGLFLVLILFVLGSSLAVPSFRGKSSEFDGPRVESNGADDSILDQIAKLNQKYDKHLYEGDIAISHNESVKVDQSKTGDIDGKFEGNSKRNAMRNREGVWQSKIVPYIIDSQLQSVTSVIQRAMNEFHRQTCVRFVRRTNEDRWIRFVKESGCWSFVGKLAGKGPQKVSIGGGCQYLGIIIHELLHALGFWHEQSRPDRNQYVEVLWENIQQGTERNFNKYSHGAIDTLKAPYDFQSIMHYGQYAFSKNGKQTIRAIINPSQTLGQRNGFTQYDVMEVNVLYDCSGPTQGWSSWSAYGPCDSNSCKKSRQRFCTSSDLSKCPKANSRGVETQVVTCPVRECKMPVDGHWGRWSSWSRCNTPCGIGNHTRTRRCSDPPPRNGGRPCPGVNNQSKGCKLKSCGIGPDDCEFEVDMCHWQKSKNTYKWQRWQGRTTSQDTGPDGDVTSELNGQGYYIYAEASGIKKGQTTDLQSKTFLATRGRCIRFFYYMYGADLGALNVYIKDVKTGTKNVLFSKSGNQGQKWIKVEKPFSSSNNYKIIFEAVCGSSFASDVALDDVMFVEGTCQGPTTSKPTTLKTTTTSPSTSRSTTGKITTAATTSLPTTGQPTTIPVTTGYPWTTTVATTRLPTTGKPTTIPVTTGYPWTTTAATTRLPTTGQPTTSRPGQGDDCNFDRNFCHWTNGRRTNKYPWSRRSYNTPSTGTGPSRDHTTGKGYYVYVETSFMSGANQTATLISKVFPPFCFRCMRFYYHMYGKDMGTLNVYIRKIDISKEYRIFSKTGNQGDQWHEAMVSFRSSYKYKIIFESVRGTSYTSDIAIDDITFTDGPCPTPRPTTTMAPTTTLPTPARKERCSFDQNYCSWTRGAGSNRYTWTRRSGGTASTNTGPSRDHTTGSGYYVYVETSSPARPGQTATLVSRIFPPAPAGRCMTFYYHMYGSTMGTLNVYIKRPNSYVKYRIFRKSGNQGNKWLDALVNIKTSYQFQIIFESVRGRSYFSDIAIDDVSLTNAPCPERCSFDQNYCSWTRGAGSNRYTWTRRSGGTASTNTGPSRDHTTGSGYYVYVETSSPARPGQTATLVSRIFHPAPAGRCMSFYYHMYGRTMGSLNVYIRGLNSSARKVFTKSGNQGNRWRRGLITIRSYSKYMIIFQAVVGSSYQSDIALDDITIANGIC